MKLNVHITGEMPGSWRTALAELADDLGFVVGEDGVEILTKSPKELIIV